MRVKEDVATTTATSPSPTCRRCTIDRAWLDADPGPAARAAGRPAGALPRGARAVGVRRGGDRRRPGRRRDVRGGASSAHRATPRAAANWVDGRVPAAGSSAPGATCTCDPADLATLVDAVDAGELSRTNAREVFEQASRPASPRPRSSRTRGLRQISDAGALARRSTRCSRPTRRPSPTSGPGKAQAIGFLVGQVMKATRGQANAALVQAALRERLDRAGEG